MPAIPDTRYEILGPVVVRPGPGAAPIALSEQHKLLLARLLLVPGARVSTDALIDALWGDKPGKTPRNSVQVAVRAVRGLLGDTDRVRRVLVTEGDAYRLIVEDTLRIDAERFRRLTERAHDLVGQRPRAARSMLEEALAAWRGPLFADLDECSWATGYARELDSLRDRAQIEVTEVRLALGEHAELESVLRLQIIENPLDERRRGQLVRVLEAAGRSAEAQIAYREAYRDLGAVGPQLRRIGEALTRRERTAPGSTPRPGATAASYYGGGRPDAVVLCALLRSRSRTSADPGLGTLGLLVDRHGGEPHPVSDDLFLATFADADAALEAAGAIAAEAPGFARVGVHAGGVVQLGDGLVGPGPARCRQLAMAAHPGQVLVSAPAAQARSAGEPELIDLGVQRFLDLSPGERVYELPTAGAADEGFPPPETLSRLRHNLPVQTTRFVGREEELGTLSRVVAQGTLVTLTGAGGCGKTRLALQLAASHAQAFADGVWFVELAEVAVGADAELLASVVAHQLGIRALPGESQSDALIRHLSDRVVLLVVDNCEHVHTASAELVSAVRAGCRGVCLVATTRRPLRVNGEHVVTVPSMAVDADVRHALPSDAVQLLLERTGPLPTDPAASEGTLATALRICRALDGLPLAIELAAAQVPLRGLQGVAAEVEAMMSGDQDLKRFVSDDPRRPDRQQTIQAAIDWSYRLLSDGEQCLLRRLAIFHGTFGIPEAQQVGRDGDARLVSLVDSSVVAVAPPLDGATRLRIAEPVRAFALDLLKRSGEFEDARAAHAEVYWALAVDAAPRLFGPGEQICLQRFEAEHDNLRGALEWHVEHGRGRDALRLVGALWWMWFSHGHLAEGCAWVKRALAIDDEPTRERVRALRAGSHLAWWLGDHVQCDAHNRALDECARAIGDEWGVAWVAMGFGAAQVFRDPAASLPLFEESKRRFDALGRTWEAGYTLHLIGGARWFGGDERAAGEAFEEAVEIFEHLGHPSVLASVERCAGLMAARCGNPARGRALCIEALRLSDAIGDRAGSAQALNFLGAISRDEGERGNAMARYAEGLRLARGVGDLWATCWALDGLAGAAREIDELEIAARILASSARLAARSWYLPSPRERELRDLDVELLRQDLGDGDFARASAEGGVMSVGEVVACALAFATRNA